MKNTMKTKDMVTFSKWDPAEYIETKEDVLAFLEGALEENDPEFLFKTIGYIARSKGMAQIAQKKVPAKKRIFPDRQ